jgi:hypothetical protein
VEKQDFLAGIHDLAESCTRTSADTQRKPRLDLSATGPRKAIVDDWRATPLRRKPQRFRGQCLACSWAIARRPIGTACENVNSLCGTLTPAAANPSPLARTGAGPGMSPELLDRKRGAIREPPHSDSAATVTGATCVEPRELPVLPTTPLLQPDTRSNPPAPPTLPIGPPECPFGMDDP